MNRAESNRTSQVSRGRALVFAVLEGLVLALPVGFWVLPDDLRALIPAPEWLRTNVNLVCLAAIPLLLVWSLVMVRKQRLLVVVGLLTAIVMVVLGLLPVT